MICAQKFYPFYLLLLLVLLFFNSEISLSQTNIQGVAGYTTVTNPPGTNTYNITSNRVINNGTAVLNRYTTFNLDTNNTANIYLATPGGVAQTAINIVNNLLSQQTRINGSVRLIAGNNAGDPVGGNLIFIDPNGIMVGQNGSINAGSILLSTSAQTYARLNGNPSEINLNDPTQDHLLNTQTININGQYRFNSITGPVRIDGTLNILNGILAPGLDPAISIFANNVNLTNTGRIFTGEGANVNLVTGRNINYNPSNNAVAPQATLLNDGRVDIAGNISSPLGNVLATTNTEDLTNNIVNLTGFIDAYSMVPGATGGVVILESANYTAGPGSPGVLINNGQITTNGDVLIHTPNNVNINNSNTVINAGGDLTIQGNGMYMAGSYYSQNGSIFITNIGSNNLLIDSSLYTNSGNINIDSNGYTIPGISQSLPAPPPVPVFQAFGNIDINANPLTSYTRIISQNGDVTINSACAAEFYGPGSVFARNNIDITGNSVIVNQTFDAMNGDLILQSNTGDFLLGQDGLLSALNGTIYIQRGNTNGPFNTEFYGIISAENTTPGLVFRNNNPANNNNDLINIDGTTFGPYGGTYSNTGTVYVDNTFAPDLYVDSFLVNMGHDQPNPPKPPTPPTKPKNPNRPDDQDYYHQLFDFTQAYQTTAINNTYNSQLFYTPWNSAGVNPGAASTLSATSYDPGRTFYGDNDGNIYSADSTGKTTLIHTIPNSENNQQTTYYGDQHGNIYSADSTGKTTLIHTIPNTAQGTGPEGDQLQGGASSNTISSQYEYEWYKSYAEANGLSWADFLKDENNIKDIPKPMTREDAWDAEDQAKQDYNDKKMAQLDAYYKRDIAKMHYNEAEEKCNDALNRMNQAKQNYDRASLQYTSTLDEDSSQKLSEYRSKLEWEQEVYEIALKNVDNAKTNLDKAQEKLEVSKSEEQQAAQNYEEAKFKTIIAEKATKASDKQQQVNVGSGGTVTVDGKTIDLNSIKQDPSSIKPSDTGTQTQSLSPRAKLDAQGRKPQFTNTGQGTELNIQGAEDKPAQIKYDNY